MADEGLAPGETEKDRVMETVAQEKRLVHYDLLRIVAAFSVVMLHCAGQKWYVLPVGSPEWLAADAWDALFRFGVPVFVMISGAVFLDRDVGVRRLYSHNIARLLAIYLIWSGIYGLYDCRVFDFPEAGWKAVVKEVLGGRYHLWLLPMIIGIYMLLPILRTWVKNAKKRELQYFVLLFLILKIGVFTAAALSRTYLVVYVEELTDIMELGFACSYIGYFVLGYYIAHYGIAKRVGRAVYTCVVPCALLNISLDFFLSVRAGEPRGQIYDSFGLFTFVIVAALFLFFTDVMSRVRYSPLAVRVIREGSAATLGVYVMHIGLLEILEERGIDSMLLPNVIGIPLLALGCFIVCSVLAAALRRIPVIGRYLC